MTPRGISRLAKAWVRVQEAYERGDISEHEWKLIYAAQNLSAHPQALWQFVLEVLALAPGPEVSEMLAAGPLEDLIRNNGSAFLSKIEAKVASNSDFADILRGVWVRAASDPVTQRYIELGCDVVRITGVADDA